MDLYYGKSSGNNIILDEEESNHLINVRRAVNGHVVHVTDGHGNLFTTELIKTEKRNCTLQIIQTTVSSGKNYHLHIAIAPTKSIDRIEWFLEKATETGIDEITFLQCRHSERKEIKEERLNRVLIAAMKQSMKTFLPKLNPMIDFKTFMEKKNAGTLLICTMEAGETDSLKKNYKAGNDLLTLIGPEGDFHPDELALALKCGYKPTTLGSSRLRTETAALTVCTLFNFINSQ
jgi:16S rRNA (uracil1498-N3)-methyltransferase